MRSGRQPELVVRPRDRLKRIEPALLILALAAALRRLIAIRIAILSPRVFVLALLARPFAAAKLLLSAAAIRFVAAVLPIPVLIAAILPTAISIVVAVLIATVA